MGEYEDWNIRNFRYSLLEVFTRYKGDKRIDAVVIGEEYDKSRLKKFCEIFNLESSDDFSIILNRSDVDAVYISQPPALHYKWAKEALKHGKPHCTCRF